MKLIRAGLLGSLGVLVCWLVMAVLIKCQRGIGELVTSLGSASSDWFRGLCVGFLACIELGSGLCAVRRLLVAAGAGRAMVAAAG